MNIPERAANLRRSIADEAHRLKTGGANAAVKPWVMPASLDDIDALAQFCEEAWGIFADLPNDPWEQFPSDGLSAESDGGACYMCGKRRPSHDPSCEWVRARALLDRFSQETP